MKIEPSSRLSYAMMSVADADLFYQLDQDEEVMRYINGGIKTSREHLNTVLLPRLESYRNVDEGWGLWKVSITSNNEFIGWILVRPMNFFSDSPELDNLELGWRFSRKSWGKGFATEAASSFKEAIVKENKVSKISAIAIKENIASINIMEKMGMIYLKTALHEAPLGEQEVVYYGLDI